MKKQQKNATDLLEKVLSAARTVQPGATGSITEKRNLRIVEPQEGSALPIREVNFVELDNGDLVELVETPDNPTQTLLAVCHKGQVRLMDRLEHRGEILVPAPRNSPEFEDVKLPRGVLPYESVEMATCWLMQFIPRIVGFRACTC